MNQDDVIRLAREAGANVYNGGPHFSWKELEAFAKLVAEHEREVCAKVCEELAELSRISETDSMWEWAECAAAIRARGTL